MPIYVLLSKLYLICEFLRKAVSDLDKIWTKYFLKLCLNYILTLSKFIRVKVSQENCADVTKEIWLQ